MSEHTPVVGKGATLVYPQDMYPYVITRVSKTGKTFWMKSLRSPDLTTGHEPARFDGPFPVWDHRYTDEELVSMASDLPGEMRVSQRKDGKWMVANGHARVALSGAVYYRNYSY